MSLKLFFSTIILLLYSVTASLGQLIAHFEFDDNNILKQNIAGKDGNSINPNARSDGEGVYTQAGESINLTIDEDILNDSEDIYLEFDFRCMESFAWLISAGELTNQDPKEFFGIGHHDGLGIRLRYYTTADPDKVIAPDPIQVPGQIPLERGERATITFIYIKEDGIAYLLKNGTEFWRTPEEHQSPGEAIHWFTKEGEFTVAWLMDGEGSTTPSLYSFKAYNDPCAEIQPPEAENISFCGPGEATITASGGMEGTYRWYETEDAEQAIEGENESSFTTPRLTTTTTYYVAHVEGPCESDRTAVTVTVHPPPDAPVAEDQESCEEGTFSLTASGGSEGNYRWYDSEFATTPLAGETNNTYTTDIISDQKDFYVSVIDDKGCESSRTKVSATVHQAPETPLTQNLEQCGPGEYTVNVDLAGNSQKPLLFKWYKSQAAVNPEKEENSGTLELILKQDTVIYVSSSNALCESNKSPVFIKVNELPYIDAGEDLTILKGESVQLQAQAGNGELFNCSWEADESLDRLDIPNPTAKPDISTTYIVKRADSNTGCVNSDTITVYVRNVFPVPNAFSPNNDGVNDTWEIPNIENYPDCTLKIYNSWGNEIFSSKGYKQPWDGSFNGQELPTGTYYYTLHLSNEHEGIKGTVSIIR